MPFVNNRGIKIHYQVDGEGPPLVLQHGSTSNLLRWYETGYADQLKEHFQLILVDARGHGRSDKPHETASYSLRLRSSDIIAVLDDLGIEKAHYWGYSMGAWIGFGIAKYASSRVSSLVLGGGHPYEDRSFDHGTDGSDPEVFFEAWGRLMGGPLDEEARADLLTYDLQAFAAYMHKRDSNEDVLPQMHMPCCLYVGEDDPRLKLVKRCAAEMPNATFVPIPNSDHAGAFVNSNLVLEPVLTFLQSL